MGEEWIPGLTRCGECFRCMPQGKIFKNWKHPELAYNVPDEPWCTRFTRFDCEEGVATYWYVMPDEGCTWGEGGWDGPKE